MSFNIVVVGATGNVGRQILSILHERHFPVRHLTAVASTRSAGQEIAFGEQSLKVVSLDAVDFADTDIVLSATSSSVTKSFISRATSAGAVVIDEADAFRLDSLVPLIVPEVNAGLIREFKNKRIIASPNCVVIPLVMVLQALDQHIQINRVVATTYQAVSGAGKAAMDELQVHSQSPQQASEIFPRSIAFNVIPQVGTLNEDGDSSEELKIIAETHKIMRSIKLAVTCVRVPVFVGHSIVLNIEFTREFTPQMARQLLSAAAGITIASEDRNYVTPIEVAGLDRVFVSRIRQDLSNPKAISMWVITDNLRKGAALNTVQIAEVLIKEHLQKVD